MKKVPVWYLVANRTEAVFYRDSSFAGFEFISRMRNDEGRRFESELVSDRPGRNTSSATDSIRHGFAAGTQHEEVALKFAREICSHMEKLCREKGVEKLVLVAPPRFLGLLRKGLSSNVKGLVSDEVRHEYKRGSDLEIREQIFGAMKKKRGDLTSAPVLL